MKLRYIFAALLCLCLLITPAAAAGGSGTAANPYIIETAAELQSMANDLSAHYRLANDIDLSGVTWSPIGSSSAGFYGELDGNGKTIKNLALNPSTAYTGFFGVITSSATIKDVTFQDCTITSTFERNGIVAGGIIMSSSTHEPVLISNVDLVRCSVSSTTRHTACFIGYINTYSVVDIMDCNINYCNTESTDSQIVGSFVGGINQYSTLDIVRCNVMNSYVYGRTNNVGGFIGANNAHSTIVIDTSTIQNSIIEVYSTGVGGFIGGTTLSSTTISNSDVINCIIKGGTYLGGLFGFSEQSGASMTAQSCEVIGSSIVARQNYAGGVAGRVISGSTGVFSDCSVTDTSIIASNYAAGIYPGDS